MESKKNLFFIGFMGVGKSTYARLVARETGRKLVEMDETIEAEAGMKISEIFERYGEAYFRDLETALIRRISKAGDSVVSCGGGAVLRPDNVEAMKENGTVLFLTATPESVFQRVRHSTHRPLLNGNMNVEYIGELMEKRRPIYEAAADVTVSTDRRERKEVLAEILAEI